MRSSRAVSVPATLFLVSLAPAAAPQADSNLFDVHGKVVNALTAEPVGGALLQIAGQPATFSDSEGNFAVTGLARGHYGLLASKPGFFNEQELGRSVSVDSSVEVPSDLDRRQTHPRSDHLRRNKECRRRTSRRSRRARRTVADATAPSYVRQGLNQHGAFFTGVVVGNGLDSEHITFRLHPQALIHGRITDQNGEPVRNASVHLFAISKRLGPLPSMQAQQQSNDLGEYRFAHLRAGKYYVAVQAKPWYARNGFDYAPATTATSHGFAPASRAKSDSALDVVYPVTFYPGVTDERSASEVSVSEGETFEANIPMRTVPAVHLRLTNMPADIPSNINILRKTFDSVMGTGVQAMEIAPGEFEIAGLPPGEITLTISHGTTGQKVGTLEAKIGGSDTLDAAKPVPSATVSGRVLLQQGSGPTADSGILLVKDGDPGTFAFLRKDGTFSLGSVPLGNYRILVNLREPKYIEKVSASGAKVSGRDLYIAGTNDIDLTVMMGGKFSTISVLAMLGERAIDGVMVLLVPDSGANLDEDARLDQSDSDGSFQLQGIVPGKYRLLAIQDGWGLDWRNPAVLKPYLEQAQSIQISANDSRKFNVPVQPRTK